MPCPNTQAGRVGGAACAAEGGQWYGLRGLPACTVGGKHERSLLGARSQWAACAYGAGFV